MEDDRGGGNPLVSLLGFVLLFGVGNYLLYTFTGWLILPIK